MIGQRLRRIEDRPLLLGQGRFAADVTRPGALHMRIVRSPVAHAIVHGIDASDALALGPDIRCFTAADLPASLPPIAPRQSALAEMIPYLQPVLALDRVRYVGEPVAVVLAADAYRAEDAADLVIVDFEELPVQLDPWAPPAPWSDGLTTEIAVLRDEFGDVDAAFAEAPIVVELELSVARHSGVPMETRGAVAWVEPDTNVLMFHGAAKVPHQNRDALAAMLGLPTRRVELHEGHVGGGFGVRGELYPEDVLVAWTALETGRPVKWIEDRNEHLVATNHSRDQHHRIRAAATSDGTLLAIDDEFWLDQGAYVRTHAATVPSLTMAMLPGPYRLPAYRVACHVVATNKTPAGTYRAPGRYEATFVRERMIDALAQRAGLDRAEVRRRNLLQPEDMPVRMPLSTLGTDVVYDSGDYPRLLDRVLDHVRYPELVAELAARRAAGDLVGLGFGFFVEKSGLGPFEGVRIDVDTAGALRVITGAASVGQGVETTVAQIVADVLGIDYDVVRVSHGQSDEMPYGRGAFASRVTVMTGSAAHQAALRVRDKAVEVAASMLEAAPEDLELVGGSVRVRGTPTAAVTLGAVAAALAPTGARALGMTAGLSAEDWFFTTHMTYPYGLHLAVARVDGDTGGVELLRYVVAYDVGRAINPMLVEGQIAGGLAQGIGGALLEQFAYDAAGQPLCTSFMDYLLPTVKDVVDVEILLSEDAPSPLNPLGVKGAGEGGTNGAGAAIAAAIDDALGQPGAITSLPVSPATVRRLLTRAAPARE